jgi:outer membrane protein assembly factor BamB
MPTNDDSLIRAKELLVVAVALHKFVAWMIALTPVWLTTGSFAAEWPEFRGPTGQGIATGDGYPTEWTKAVEDGPSAAAKNVTWTVDIPGRGWSSPVVEKNRIWLTTATEEGRSLRAICINAAGGEVLKDVEVFRIDEPGSIHTKNSHASPTPVIDGERIFVHFGAHGTACLTGDGEAVWKTRLAYAHGHGPAGSPVVWNNLLIVNCDGTDVQYVAALDKQTGELRWKAPREHISEARRTGKSNVPMAYTTPLLIEVGGQTQLVSSGSDQVSAYDPTTGKELWWANYDGYSNVVRPAFAHGMVFVSSGYEQPTFYAVKVDGTGNVTKTHIAWSLQRGAPLNPSPLPFDDILFIVSDNGIASCLDIATGKPHWQERLGGTFSASPTYASEKIYWVSEDGTTTVTSANKEFEKVAENQLDEQTLATPAFVDGVIYFRTETKLYAITAKASSNN